MSSTPILLCTKKLAIVASLAFFFLFQRGGVQKIEQGLSMLRSSDDSRTLSVPPTLRSASKILHGDNATTVSEHDDEQDNWPSEMSLAVPLGTYSRRPRRTENITETQPPVGRVLLYITTHFSKQHEMFFRYCWKNVVSRSPLLQNADVGVFLNINPTEEHKRRPAMDVLNKAFPNNNLKVYLRDTASEPVTGPHAKDPWDIRVKRFGAVVAVQEGVAENYFDGYDWIIRVNPDVLIQDDKFFRENMANPDLNALIVNCRHQRPWAGMHLHSDFFVVRPTVFEEEKMPREILSTGAEMTFTHWMHNELSRRPVTFKRVPGADPINGRTCRVGHGKDFFDTPVVHEHALHPEVCEVPEMDIPIVKGMFPDWPENWKPV